MRDNIKVLVVGAGPGGSSAAYFLKHYDRDNIIKVDLVDRLNSDKYSLYHDMCGEGVSSDILKDFEPFSPDGVVGKIQLIREFYPNNIEIQTKMDGLLIDRVRFFSSIIDEFVRLDGSFQRNSVENFFQDDKKVKIKYKTKIEKYDYVIAADGANSLFRKHLGIKGNTKSLAQYIIDKKPEKNTIRFFYDEIYEGDYMWEFPHNEKTKIGYPIIKGKIFRPTGKILVKQARTVGYGGLDRYISGRVLLVGDAACQANPITKGGIRAAMIAGKLAAKAIVDNDPKQYEKDWLKTKFSSKLFIEAFKKLKEMNNTELAKHIKPFGEVNMNSTFSKSILYAKIFLLYARYVKLYRAYDLSNKYGW